MLTVRKFPYIPVKIPRHDILIRLGYRGRTTEIPREQMEQLDVYIEETAGIIELTGVCLRCGIESTSEGVSLKDDTAVFDSEKLAGFLSDSDQILMMGITGGKAVADEISRLQQDKQMTKAVVMDAAASEIVDEGFNWIAGLYAKELVREGRRLTVRRFSAGYGDFDIRYQQDIYRILDLQELGITITESSLMLPEKSVTAIYGIQGNDNE